MSKFRCVCGEVIRISGSIPNPDEILMISDNDFVEFHGKDFVDPDELYLAFTFAYRCPRSGHLWMFWDGLESDPSCYEPLGEDKQAERSREWSRTEEGQREIEPPADDGVNGSRRRLWRRGTSGPGAQS